MTYIALLRGINVSGQKQIRMESLRASFSALGFKSVKTYIQSGNVIFESPRRSAASLVKKIQPKILEDFGFSVPLVIRTSDEWAKVARSNPFLKSKGVDVTKLCVVFLEDTPSDENLETLRLVPAGKDKFIAVGKELFLFCPSGFGNTKLSNVAIEKKLALRSTARNWKTVEAILKVIETD